MRDSEMFIHMRPKVAEEAIDEVIADSILPQLQTLIKDAAKGITDRPGFEDSPYAREFAAELIIKGVAGFLALTSFEDTETARLSMFGREFVDWWFGFDSKE